jgi:hypothetical protein
MFTVVNARSSHLAYPYLSESTRSRIISISVTKKVISGEGRSNSLWSSVGYTFRPPLSRSERWRNCRIWEGGLIMGRKERWDVGRGMRQKGKLKFIETSQMRIIICRINFIAAIKFGVGIELCFTEFRYISLLSISSLWHPPSKLLLFTIVPYFIPILNCNYL